MVIEGSCGFCVVNTVYIWLISLSMIMSRFSHLTGVNSCLVMAEQLVNALEMLIKSGDMKKGADILEQGCSKKREQKPSK